MRRFATPTRGGEFDFARWDGAGVVLSMDKTGI
jgi:hypothetical protein